MLLLPLVERYNQLTKTEKKLADYFIRMPEQALCKTIEELSVATHASPSTILRFAKKLDYEGYTEMKEDLLRYTSPSDDLLIQPGDSYQNCADKLIHQIHEVCTVTAKSLSDETLTAAVNAIDRADNIYLYAEGSSQIAASDFHQKLSRLHKKCFIFQDSHVGLVASSGATERDVVFAISFFGETNMVLRSMESAKKQGAYTIALTGNENSSVAELTDLTILTPAMERTIRSDAVSSHYSQQFVCDLIYLCLMMNHREESEQILLSTSQIMDEPEPS